MDIASMIGTFFKGDLNESMYERILTVAKLQGIDHVILETEKQKEDAFLSLAQAALHTGADVMEIGGAPAVLKGKTIRAIVIIT